MNTLTSTQVNLSLFKLNQKKQFASINSWQLILAILFACSLIGYAVSIISGITTIVLIGGMVLTLFLKPIYELIKMDLDLSNIDLKDMHDELWN